MRKTQALDPSPILVNTAVLAERWGVTARTVIRVCRIHAVHEIRLCLGGRILYRCTEIRDLEKQLFPDN